MKGLLTICARGGSKGVPGKNIKYINGRPLIEYSVQTANLLAEELDIDIYLSTDSSDIKEVVQSLGYPKMDTTYDRPAFLASDSAGKLDAITDLKNHAERSNNIKYDIVIDLDVTSPLRTVEDLKKAIHKLIEVDEALNLFSVSPANRNPYFNMVEEQPNGYFALCKTGQFMTRQSAPKVYDMNASFYVFKDKFFHQAYKTVITEKSLVYEVPHLCFDLDHPIDFDIMSYLLENRKLDFEFNY